MRRYLCALVVATLILSVILFIKKLRKTLDNHCPSGTLASKYNVPKEPASGRQITFDLVSGDKKSFSVESRLVNATTYTTRDGKHLYCLCWALRNTKNVIDYVTCRHTIDNGKNSVSVSDDPLIYGVDVAGSANGNFSKFIVFTDSDLDGDICDQEFALYE